MSASALLPVVAMLVGGMLLAVQAPTNALLARAVGSPLNAAFVSFAVGAAGLGLVALIVRDGPGAQGLAGAPWYAWVGGLYGAVLVAAAAWAAPKLGAGFTFTLAVVGQVVCAVALDHVGALGLERHPASWLRLAGAACVIGGAVMVRLG